MKKLLFILVLLVTVSGSSAQTNVYHPFPTHDAFWGESWHCFITLTNNEACRYYQNYLVGDTVVGSYTYHKIRYSGVYFDFGHCGDPYYTPTHFNSYLGAYREDTLNKKVYYLPSNHSSDTLLYDFNLNIGDALPISYINDNSSNVVTRIDSILIGNKYRKRYGITGNGFGGLDTNYVYLIEGVGSSFGLFGKIQAQAEAPCGSNLNCFMQNGIKLFPDTNGICGFVSINEIENKKSFTISPNPFSISTQITFDKTYPSIALSLYDLQGKLLLQNHYADCNQITLHRNQLPNGLYFLKLIIDDKQIETRKIVVGGE